MGGKAAHENYLEKQKQELPGHGNPGNFANRPKEEVREIASMGGKASGGFANMDPEKQVRISLSKPPTFFPRKEAYADEYVL